MALTDSTQAGGAAWRRLSEAVRPRISKSFSGNQVLSGIDLDIYPGELVAFTRRKWSRQVHILINCWRTDPT